jgi:hypothetical protein
MLVSSLRWTAFGSVAVLALLGASSAHAADTKNACIDAAEAAQKLRTSGHLTEARAQLLQCTRDACPKVVRDDCTSWITEVDKETPSIVVRARSPKGDDVDGAILIDGKPAKDHADGTAIALDPGPHVVRVVPGDAGLEPAESKVIVAAGEKNRIVAIALPAHGGTTTVEPVKPASGKSSTSWVGWLLGGVGVAGMVAFTVVQVVAQGEYSDMKDSACGKASTCGPDVLDPIRAKFQASGVLLGVSSALLVSGVVWIIATAGSGGAAKPAAWLTVAPTLGGGAVGLSGRF